MSQVQEINIQLDGISNVIKSKRFRVPPYQRSYAWEQEHVEALLSDVKDAIKNQEKEYFLGSIVVTGPNEQRRFEVVDGQQRLTTVSLLISAIKDRFATDGDEQVVATIRSEFLVQVDRKTKEGEPKLTLNEVDNELYQELIMDIEKLDESKYSRQSHKRLIAATRQIRKYIDDLCESSSEDSEELLHEWLDYLETNIKVILVTAPDDSNAFVIFETLNDRGLELAISDLMKNYLFHRSAEKLEETKSRWLTMVATLESASEDAPVVQYLRHFAMSKYGLVREKELFGLLKKKVTSKRTALSFSTELSNSARVYSALINTDHEFWKKYDASAKEAAGTLNQLGMVQVRPLLLAILDKFDPKKASAALQKLVAISVRFQIVGATGGGTLEKIYSDVAQGVSDGKYKTVAEILKNFITLPSDATFERAFSEVSVSKTPLARYYLSMLEKGFPGRRKELVPSTDIRDVNLEHVLPLTPNEDWETEWSSDDARTYYRRLGNLAIMSAKENSTIGNTSFAEKKSIYKQSAFAFTKSLSRYKEWNKEAIEKRQAELAKIAVKVWSIK